jgi:mycothiol synthase
MVQVRAQRSLSPAEHAQVTAFLEAAYAAGSPRLNDHLTSDLTHGERDGFRAALATEGDDLVGYAQASAANDGVTIGAVSPRLDVSAPLLHELLRIIPAGAAVTWWSTEASAAIAADVGLAPHRRLFRMGRPLPIANTTDVALRPFRVDVDEHEWLAVNNAAFATHGEQGGWDLATLQQREREPWFDAAGFLLHERAGRLAAFCWTKVHPGPVVTGEIYVIAVHPDFHGHGLGKALTVAGLQHLHSVGAEAAMLYVDAANEAAVGLYRALGFQVEHTDQSYHRSAQRSSQGASR